MSATCLFILHTCLAAPCPISGSLSFSYQLGPGRNCSSPLSSITQCQDQNTFMMKYQACPDMQGSQSITEQVECIAQWKEGSVRYFAAQVNSTMTNRPWEWENMFRCFVYRPQYNGWLLAQSGEAKCNLHKATEGYRTMSIKQGENDILMLHSSKSYYPQKKPHIASSPLGCPLAKCSRTFPITCLYL